MINKFVEEAIDNIERGFLWEDTKQGRKYWEKVISNLQKMLKSKKRKLKNKQ